MSQIEALCLNHRDAFAINNTQAKNHPSTFDICMSAGHRMFHFYDGIQDPTPYAWMHSVTDLDRIEESLQSAKYKDTDYRIEIDTFLDVWQQIVSLGFMPEWFIFVPDAFFGTDSIETNMAPKKRILTEITDVLTIYDRVKIKDPDEKAIWEKDKARERKQAYCDMQRVDRNGEGDYLTFLRKWQKSQNTEQRWLGVMSMFHYLRGGISDFDDFYVWLKKSLVDKYYLIRSESLDMLQSLAVSNQSLSLQLIDKLNGQREFPLQVAAYELIRRFIQPEVYYGHRYFEQLRSAQFQLTQSISGQFTKICKAAGKNVISWVEKLYSQDSHWHDIEAIERAKSIINRGFEESSMVSYDNYVVTMNRLLNAVRLSKEYFLK